MTSLKYIYRLIAAFLITSVATTALTGCSDEPEYAYDNELHTFGPCPVLRGETIEIIGTGLNGLTKVIFPVDVEITEFESKSDSKVVVKVPQEARPGQMRFIINGKEIVSKSPITYAEPISIESVTTTSEILNAGDVVVVKGDYLYNVSSITFGNEASVEAADFILQNRHEIRVAVPLKAKSGKIVFSDGADWEETTDKVFNVSTASVSSLSKTFAEEGESIVINGERLNLVNKILFPGDVEALGFSTAADGKSITVIVPTGTCSGTITLELYSLDKISTPAISVPTISITSVTPDTNVEPGQKLTVKGTLLDRVTQIIFPGGESITSGWSVNGDGTQLEVAASPNMVDGRITFVQNANISVESNNIVMKKEGNVFWTGNINLGNWATNLEVAAEKNDDIWTAFSENITGPGQLTIEFEEDASCGWWQIQPRYRKDWSTCFTNVRDDNGGIHNMDPGQDSWTINITQEDFDELKGAGWAFSGCNLTIKSMSFTPSK